MILTTLIGGNRESRTLTDGTYMIGRNPSCQIQFEFPDVSERHAILTVRGNKAGEQPARRGARVRDSGGGLLQTLARPALRAHLAVQDSNHPARGTPYRRTGESPHPLCLLRHADWGSDRITNPSIYRYVEITIFQKQKSPQARALFVIGSTSGSRNRPRCPVAG